jgi:hypothetical protein
MRTITISGAEAPDLVNPADRVRAIFGVFDAKTFRRLRR